MVLFVLCVEKMVMADVFVLIFLVRVGSLELRQSNVLPIQQIFEFFAIQVMLAVRISVVKSVVVI